MKFTLKPWNNGFVRCLGGQLLIGIITALIIMQDFWQIPQTTWAQQRPRHKMSYTEYMRFRRRNDSVEGAIVPATEVFVLDEIKESIVVNSEVSAKPEVDSGDDKSANSTAEVGTAETIGIIRGFLPGFGGGKGKGAGGGGGLFKAFGGGGFFGGGKGKGLFGGGQHGSGGGSGDNGGGNTGGGGDGGKVKFPEYPTNGPNENTGTGGYSSGPATPQQTGWGSGDTKETGSSGGGGGGLFGGGGGLFKNPFGGGGGGRGKGRSPFRFLSRLNSDQPCAAGLGDLPILSRVPFVPKGRFPNFIPSGVNTCDKTCDSKEPGGGGWSRVDPTQKEKAEMEKEGATGCTYNWRDSLTGFPFLLFRCQCKLKCPPKRVRLSAGLLNAHCENVSEKKSRCKCPYGQQSYKCSLSFLPVKVPLIGRTKPYYCTCCNDKDQPQGEPLGLGGYGGYMPQQPSTESTAQSQLDVSVGGYSNSNAGGYSLGTSASETSGVKDTPRGKPLGISSIYDHLRRF